METLESQVKLAVGDVVKATVQQVFQPYAVMSIGDVAAYLPSTEYSWQRKNNLKKELNVGAELESVVVQITEQGVMLSIKRLQSDPWKTIDQLYQEGQEVSGKVVEVCNYGAFVKLGDVFQGLLHKKSMSEDGNKDVNEVVSEGQEINVIISSINKKERKMSFTIKSFSNNND